jgi:hypothetical protein
MGADGTPHPAGGAVTRDRGITGSRRVIARQECRLSVRVATFGSQGLSAAPLQSVDSVPLHSGVF